jgi:peptidoglycan/LPS O-acetylase OafA/YrhL
LKYLPFIDGLRALAVGSVILFHAGLGCPGGYVGVDVFFVISGYLVTSLLLRVREQPCLKEELLEFWSRRIRRLFPALAVCLLTTWLLGWFLLLPADFRDLGQSILAQLMLVSNLFFWKTTGYFRGQSESKPLLHTWSLAIEEQFYLFLPLIVFCLPRKHTQHLVSIFFLVSLLLNIGLTGSKPSIAFFGIPTRAWELLMGSILAFFPSPRLTKGVANSLTVLGLSLILIPIFSYSRATAFPGWAALWPCLGCALILASNTREQSTVGNLLSLRPLQWTGLASYSLYLWHWPVFAFASYCDLEKSLATKIALTMLGAALGTLSYSLVEKHTRQAEFLKSQGTVFRIAGCVYLLLFGLCFSVSLTGGIPSRVSPEVLSIARVETDLDQSHETSLADARAGSFNVVGKAPSAESIPTCFVWGDSHAMALTPALESVSSDLGIQTLVAGHRTTPPCQNYVFPLLTDGLGLASAEYNRAVLEHIIRKKIRRVLLVGDWGVYLNTAEFEKGLSTTVDALAASGTQVYLLEQVPQQPTWLPRSVGLAEWHQWDTSKLSCSKEEYHKQKSRMPFAQGSTLRSKVILLDPTELFFPADGSHRVGVNASDLVYRDDNHLSAKGSLILAPLLRSFLLGQ